MVNQGSFRVCAPSQYETTLQCNVVSYWLGAYTTWSSLVNTRNIYVKVAVKHFLHIAFTAEIFLTTKPRVMLFAGEKLTLTFIKSHYITSNTYAQRFVVLCFVMFILVFLSVWGIRVIHLSIFQGCSTDHADTCAIAWLRQRQWIKNEGHHYSDVIISQIASPVTHGFPSQRASNAENVSIWWRHHDG